MSRKILISLRVFLIIWILWKVQTFLITKLSCCQVLTTNTNCMFFRLTIGNEIKIISFEDTIIKHVVSSILHKYNAVTTSWEGRTFHYLDPYESIVLPRLCRQNPFLKELWKITNVRTYYLKQEGKKRIGKISIYYLPHLCT